jgi:hypothetical protein
VLLPRVVVLNAVRKPWLILLPDISDFDIRKKPRKKYVRSTDVFKQNPAAPPSDPQNRVSAQVRL